MIKMGLLVFVLFVNTMIYSQSSYTAIQYKKNMQPALSLELANNTEEVKATILDKLKKAGYKPETEGHLFWKDNIIDGFYVFNNVLLPSISSNKLDMYFKVAQKNAEEKGNSRLYLLVSTGNENFNSPTNDSILWNSSRLFLDAFVDNTTAYSLEQHIRQQEGIIADSEKNLSKLREDEKNLEQTIKKAQNDLISNQNNQVTRQLDMENQRKSLENLRLKRRI